MFQRLFSSTCRSCYYEHPYLSILAGISYITLLSVTHHNSQQQYNRAIKTELLEIKKELEKYKMVSARTDTL